MERAETPDRPAEQGGPDPGDEPTRTPAGLPTRPEETAGPAAAEPDEGGEPPEDDTAALPLPVTAVPASPGDLLPPPGLHPPRVLRRLAVAAGAGLLLAGALAVAAVGGETAAPRPAAVGGETAAPRPAAVGGETAAPRPAAGDEARWGAAPAHTVRGARDGRTESGLDLVSAASAVTVRSAPLGDDLYRVTTPPGGALPHAADAGGRVRVSLDGSGERAVEILLSDRVRWDLGVAGGAEQHRIDLSGSRLRRVDLAGGAGRIVLVLPRPEGTLRVRLAGGVREFAVRTVGAVPVRVRVGSGAGRVVLGGRTHAGVAAGALLTPERWDDAGGRVDLDAAAGLAQLTVDAT